MEGACPHSASLKDNDCKERIVNDKIKTLRSGGWQPRIGFFFTLDSWFDKKTNFQ
jgi:hypothetical protein